MTESDFISFATPEEMGSWLSTHHADRKELWVRLFKIKSGVPSVTWEQAVIEALAWGWVDGVKKSLDAQSWLQRFTPRRARSKWSKKNRGHAEKLIADGRMQPSGLAQVEAARADGRWDEAYAGQSGFEIPADFLSELEKNAAAKAHFETLSRQNLFAIYYRLHTVKRAETRRRNIENFIAMLARGETFH